MSDAGDKGAAGKAQELKEAIKKLDFRDQVILLGSAALVILFFLPWWRVSWTWFGDTQSESANGLGSAGWVGFLAACACTVAGLANMGFVPLTGEPKALAGKTMVQAGLAAVALLMGPIFFLGNTGGRKLPGPFGEVGYTLFFWLALIAAAAVAGAAGWKLADERKAAGPPA